MKANSILTAAIELILGLQTTNQSEAQQVVDLTKKSDEQAQEIIALGKTNADLTAKLQALTEELQDNDIELATLQKLQAVLQNAAQQPPVTASASADDHPASQPVTTDGNSSAIPPSPLPATAAPAPAPPAPAETGAGDSGSGDNGGSAPAGDVAGAAPGGDTPVTTGDAGTGTAAS